MYYWSVHIPVGCDKHLQLMTVKCSTLDRCGVYNGNGSTCVEKSGTQTLQHLGKVWY